MTFTPRTTIAWLTVLGIAVWFASQTVKAHPISAAAACLATLLFSARFVGRGLSPKVAVKRAGDNP